MIGCWVTLLSVQELEYLMYVNPLSLEPTKVCLPGILPSFDWSVESKDLKITAGTVHA